MQKNWYIVSTYSGNENAIKEDIENIAKTRNLKSPITNVLVPERVVEELDSKGRKKLKIEKLYPSYVFVEIEVKGEYNFEIDDETWYIIRNIPRVTGFIGSSGKGAKPIPVEDKEMLRVFKQVGLAKAVEFHVKEGDPVIIGDGPFKGTLAKLVKIDEEKEEAVVVFEILGREVEQTLEIEHLEKIK